MNPSVPQGEVMRKLRKRMTGQKGVDVMAQDSLIFDPY